MKKREKTGLVFVIILSVALPFALIKNPLEIPSMVLPLWIWYPGMAGVWFHSGKNLLEVFLACYGAGNIGIIFVYFGTGLVQFIFKKVFLRKEVSKIEAVLSKIDFPESKKREFINWLELKNIWLILFIFFLPFPWSDSIATVAMRLRRIKYGIWYLFGLNTIHVLLVVFLVSSGMNLFF